jgi:hypothetical protein
MRFKNRVGKRVVNAGVKMSFFWRFENAESNGAPG